MASPEHGETTAIADLAEAALPTLRVERSSFARYLEAHDAGRELVRDASAANAAERAAELLLACGIAAGDEEAVRLFDARYVEPLARTLGKMRLSPSELDEVKQLVREKLLVRDATGRARVEEYAGRGRLMGLVQVVATREALGLLRRAKREIVATDDDLAEPVVGAKDPGTVMLVGRYREAFRAAFADAVGRLTPRQRNLLRMHLLGGVTLEQLSAIHGAHRATIVRWLRDAREEVLTATKAHLRAALHVRADELESLMGLAQSRLDVSIERLLRTHGDADEPGDLR